MLPPSLPVAHMPFTRIGACLLLFAALALAGAPPRSPPRRSEAARRDAGVARRADAGTAFRFGTVEIKIRGAAVVYVDGRELGKTPLKPVKLLEGSHQLRVVNEALGVDYTETFEVTGDHRSVMELSFEQE